MRKSKLIDKILGIALVLMLIGAMLPFGTFGSWSLVEASTAIIYVPDDYSTIQAAVNASSSGDTIIVRDGTYIENVDVNKDHLTIQSESGAGATVVQALNSFGNVLYVTADYADISGFTVTGSANRGVYLHHADNCDISSVVSKGNGSGILVHGCSNCTLTGNVALNNTHWSFTVLGTDLSEFTHDIGPSNTIDGKPIYYWVDKENQQVPDDAGYVGIVKCRNITVSDLTLANNGEGILLAYSSGSTIENVSVVDNARGIVLRNSFNNVLNNNSISNNFDGILLTESYDNRLTGNTLNSNRQYGIWISKSSNNTLTDNSMSNNLWNFSVEGGDYINDIDISNTVNGKPVYYLVDEHDALIDSATNAGYVAVIRSTNVTVKDLILTHNGQGVLVAYSNESRIENIIAANDHVGIFLERSSNNVLSKNIVSESILSGIKLSDSFCNTLEDNRVSDGMNWGIILTTSSNNTLKNNIVSNSQYNAGLGLYYVSSENVICLNNFVDNTWNVDTHFQGGASNTWNSHEETTYIYNNKIYTSYLGNYWSDYAGSDADGDGIGNTPYPIDSDVDNYPLVQPFENYMIFEIEEIQLSLQAGWNMVSVPVTTADNSTSAVFPGVAGIFAWNATSRSYYIPTVIDPEKGYWVAVTENTTISINGTPVDTWTTDIKAGWNMIGSVATNSSIADPNDDPDGSVIPTAYWWDPVSKSYILTTDIEPGKGYWVASVNDCTLTL